MNLVRIGRTILVASEDFGRFCLHCGDPVHPPDPPHLCKDVAARLREWEARDRDAAFRAWARELVVLGGEA